MKKFLKSLTIKLDRFFYQKNEFVIISNNCWGGEVYKRLGLKYNSPFVGLFIYGPDYLKLLERFDYYISRDLYFVNKSKWTKKLIKYPIGILDDIEIHFMHYENSEEALSKWNRRLSRMKLISNKDFFFFKICDRDNTTKDLMKRFHQLSYKNKISFGIFDFNNSNHLKIEESENNKYVPDAIKLFNLSNKYIDVLNWIKTGKVKTTLYSKLKFSLEN